MIDTSTVGAVHFRCAFGLKSDLAREELWRRLTRFTRNWISETPRFQPPTTNDAYGGGWYFTGGEWRPPLQPGYVVSTSREIGKGTDICPEFWALRYEHPCSSEGRVWQMNVGITSPMDGITHISILALHSMRADFIGRERTPPDPTAPKLVTGIVTSPYWQCMSGTQLLKATPTPLKTGDGERFREILEDSGRHCPIVLVSRDFHTGQPKIDAKRLAWLVAGAASVYESDTPNLDKELEWCLGRRFSCWNGMIRVYQPEVRFGSPFDARRHRYFRGDDILPGLEAETVSTLVKGIARRSIRCVAARIQTVADVLNVSRERALAELRSKASNVDKSEWIELLETTNQELTTVVRSLEKENALLRSQVADASDQADENKRRQRYDSVRATEAEREVKQLKEQIGQYEDLSALPTTIQEVVQSICKLRGHRIALTSRAISSLDSCDFDDAQTAWRCMWAMSTHLWDLFFDENKRGGDIEQKFKDITGISLAMTEGKMTKKDSSMMSLREDVFAGQRIDVTPHVKFDKGSCRAYFAPVESANGSLIVVGWIGHLDTAGTRKRK